MSLLERQLDTFKAARTAEDRLALALSLLAEVTASHRDRHSAHYNECDTSPCFFCELVAVLKGTGAQP